MEKYKDSFNDRMKHNYENRAKTYLTRRMPVIIRLDPLVKECNIILYILS